jgi:hypothetical protein
MGQEITSYKIESIPITENKLLKLKTDIISSFTILNDKAAQTVDKKTGNSSGLSVK